MRIFSSAEYCLRVALRMSLIALAAPVWRVCDFCLIFVPFGHYDEPQILPYAITLICPIGADVRQKDLELILRFFAFFYYSDKYRRPMKLFLNQYMASNRQLKRQTEKELTEIFARTTSLLYSAVGRRAFRPRRAVNAAVVDSLMTGVARRLRNKGDIKNEVQFVKAYETLIGNPDYLSAVETGTSQEANVEVRLTLAEEAFAEVK